MLPPQDTSEENLMDQHITIHEHVHFLHQLPGVLFAETSIEPRDGRSLEALAQAATTDPTISAFYLTKEAEAKAVIDGRTILLVSSPWPTSSTIFIGGTMYTLEEFRAKNVGKTTLLDNITTARVILTRTGLWLPFRYTDLHIPEQQA